MSDKPVYQLKMSNGSWIDQELVSYEYNLKHGHEVRTLYPASAYEALQKENAELKEQIALFVGVEVAAMEQGEKSVCMELTEANAAQAKLISDLEQFLKSIERYVNHHGQNPKITAQEALSMVQHHPYILQITKSYKDGVIPNTRNPYAEIETQAKRIAEQKEDNLKQKDLILNFQTQYAKDQAEIESLRKQVEILLGSARKTVLALAHASIHDPIYTAAYDELSESIKLASKNGE